MGASRRTSLRVKRGGLPPRASQTKQNIKSRATLGFHFRSDVFIPRILRLFLRALLRPENTDAKFPATLARAPFHDDFS